MLIYFMREHVSNQNYAQIIFGLSTFGVIEFCESRFCQNSLCAKSIMPAYYAKYNSYYKKYAKTGETVYDTWHYHWKIHI
jgi:hypothetical protein